MTSTLTTRAPRRTLRAAMRSRSAAAVASAVFATVVFGATTAVANHDANVVHACQRTQTGTVRLVTSPSDCQAQETAVEWNKQGPAGPAGPPGASGAAYSVRVPGPVPVWWYCRASSCDEFSSVAWLDLPAGKYLVSAKAWFRNTRGFLDGDADAKCFLYDHGGHDRDDTNLFMPRTTAGHSGLAASWSIAIDTAAPVQVNLMCGSGDSEGRIKAHDIRINAVKVDALSAA
ncbi:MAG TPA: hypothetical protein VGV86_14725 [Acidimicrobiales bacterium]|nr:hypothetical protein [Acidimicrobiales bacterium]